MTVPIRLKRGTWTTAKLIPHLFSPRSTAIAECIRVYIVPSMIYLFMIISQSANKYSVLFHSPAIWAARCLRRFTFWVFSYSNCWHMANRRSFLSTRSFSWVQSQWIRLFVLSVLVFAFSWGHLFVLICILGEQIFMLRTTWWPGPVNCMLEAGCCSSFQFVPLDLLRRQYGPRWRWEALLASSPPDCHVILIRPSTEHQHRIKIILRSAERREEWKSKSEIKIKLIVEQPQIVYNKHPLAEF